MINVKKALLVDIATHLLMASIFVGAFLLDFGPVTTNPGPILALFSIVLLHLVKGPYLSKRLLIIFFLLFLHGVFNIALENLSPVYFFKVYFSTLIYFWAFSLLFNATCDYDKILKIYLFYCVVVAIIGLAQAGCYLLNIGFCYDFSWLAKGWSFAPGGPVGIRLNSILYEPSQVAFTMGAAISLATLRLFGTAKRFFSLSGAVCILIFAILSHSSTVVVVILFTVLLFVIKPRRLVFILAVMPVLFMVVVGTEYFASTQHKLMGLITLFSGSQNMSAVDATTFTLFMNAQVAWENLTTTYFMGGGLGSHEKAFDAMLGQQTLPFNVYNSTSAGNLVIRTTSELGIVGVAALVLFIVYQVSRIPSLITRYQVVYIALTCGVIAFMVRNGSYSHYGIAFYISMFAFYSRAVTAEESHEVA